MEKVLFLIMELRLNTRRWREFNLKFKKIRFNPKSVIKFIYSESQIFFKNLKYLENDQKYTTAVNILKVHSSGRSWAS